MPRECYGNYPNTKGFPCMMCEDMQSCRNNNVKRVKDNLVKYECLDCDEQFILSQNVSEKAKQVRCPYCIYVDVEATVWQDNPEVLEQLGCLGMSHWEEDIETCNTCGRQEKFLDTEGLCDSCRIMQGVEDKINESDREEA